MAIPASDPLARRLRVGILSPTVDKRHGTERLVAEWISHLADRCEIVLYSHQVEDLDLSKVTWRRVPRFPGPHLVQFIWWVLANHLWRWWDRCHGRSVDLVYSPGVNCVDADVISVHIVFAEFYHRLRHELEFRRHPIRFWPRLAHRKVYYRLLMMLEHQIYRRGANRLVPIARKTVHDLRRWYARQETADVLYVGVDRTRFNPQARSKWRRPSRLALSVGNGTFVALLIGNDFEKKGLPTVMRALAHLRGLPIKLLVVGQDDPQRYEPQIEQLALREGIRFLSPCRDVESYYAAADVYVGPSLEDTFALPPMEAMACGLPVIVSSTNGTAEIMTDGQDGLILSDPTDASALAQAIRTLYDNPPLCDRLGGAAAQRAAQFTWERNVDQLLRVFEEVVAGKRSAQTKGARRGCG